MNCSRFETLLSDYLENQLDPRVRSAAEEHLGGCLPCREILETVAAVRLDLKELPVADPPPGLVGWILDQTTGRPQKRSLWSDLILPTLTPFLSQRFAMATAFMFVFTSLVVSVLGPGFSVSGADLTPAALLEKADRLSTNLYRKTAELNNYKNRFLEEIRFLKDDLSGRLDYHLITLLFQRYSESLRPDQPEPGREIENTAPGPVVPPEQGGSPESNR